MELAKALHDERDANNTRQVDCWACESVNSPTIKALVHKVGLAEALLALPRPGKVDRDALAEVLEDHEIVWRGEIGQRTPQCSCDWMPAEWGSEDEFFEEHREHRTDAVADKLDALKEK